MASDYQDDFLNEVDRILGIFGYSSTAFPEETNINLDYIAGTTLFEHYKRKADDQDLEEFECKKARLLMRNNKSIDTNNIETFLFPNHHNSDSIFDDIDDVTFTNTEKNISLDASVVYIDIETSALSSTTAEVLQIAAKFDDREFNVHIMPSYVIPNKSAGIAGRLVNYKDMYLHGEQVKALPKEYAYEKFMQFLKSIRDPIYLVSHNGLVYDLRLLVRDMCNCNLLEDFVSIVHGFIDSLLLMRKRLSERREQKLRFRLTDLAKDILGLNHSDKAHNALQDVRILRKLIKKVDLTTEDLIAEAVPARQSIEKWNHLQSLSCLKGVVSPTLITKAAESGLGLTHLLSAYHRNGRQGVKCLLTEEIDGHPRVTKNEKVIDKIIQILINS